MRHITVNANTQLPDYHHRPFLDYGSLPITNLILQSIKNFRYGLIATYLHARLTKIPNIYSLPDTGKLVIYLLYHVRDLDILPSLKQMGFLDTNARNPDITIAGITLALQFGNALPKYITGCKNITVVDCAARRAYPRAVA